MSGALAEPRGLRPAPRRPPARPQGRSTRVLRVLKLFAVDGQAEFGVHEVARQLGLSPATVFRDLAGLSAEGFLEQDPATGRYHLGSEAFFLGLACLNRKRFGTECLPILRELSAQTGESVNLGVLRGHGVTYVHQIESAQPLRYAWDGPQIPVHTSALGKVLLAHQPEARQRAMVAELELTRYTPSTITDRDYLLAHLRLVRERGYALSDEEAILGVRGMAVPVFDYTGETVAALSVVGPAARLSLEQLAVLRPAMESAAARLSRQLGWRSELPQAAP